MQRRKFLQVILSLSLAYTLPSWSATSMVSIMQYSDAGKPLGRATLPKVSKDAEWKRTLTPLAYNVTREQGTERAFSQPGYNNQAPGLYRCVCCDNALFDAKTKYESGTGWPSFWQPIAAENVRKIEDRLFGRCAPKCAALVRSASGPRVRRRPETHRTALLHECRGDALCGLRKTEGRDLSRPDFSTHHTTRTR